MTNNRVCFERAIAAVVADTGNVTALKAGKTTITATVTSPDGTKTPYSYTLVVE